MNFLDGVKTKLSGLRGKAQDQRAAQNETAEEDVEADPAVAGSRAKRDGEDGSYVGRTNPQFDAEVQESGAEARSEAARESGDDR